MSEIKTQDIILWSLKDIRPLLRSDENSLEDFIDVLHMFGALQQVKWTSEQFREFMLGDEDNIAPELKKIIFLLFKIDNEKIQLLKNKYSKSKSTK